MPNDHVTLSVRDATEMRAFVARPAKQSQAGLLLFQDALGVNVHLRGVAERLAGEGFVVIAPELFHRFAPGLELLELEIDVIMPLIKQLTTEGTIADIHACYDWLATQPGVD